MDVAPSTIAVFADIACPWAHVALHRMHARRRRLGLEGRVAFDLRPFPLEVINGRCTPKRVLDAEIPVAGTLEPEAGWQVWQDDPSRYPVSTLLALEAVQAAKAQGIDASEALDRALRRALFAESRCVTMRHVILEVADECGAIDVSALATALDEGRARGWLSEMAVVAAGPEVEGSPHLFLPDGTNAHNPGIDMHWQGPPGKGFPVVATDRPEVYDDLLRRAAG